MSFTRFGNSMAGSVARKEAIELNYVFDFDASETVVYTGAGPFPGRVFVLHFWRYAKDGVMHLLGYEKTGHWRDHTRCYPDSYVRYHRPQRPHSGDAPGHEQPQDAAQHRSRPALDLEQLAYRVPLLELDHGVWELPTLKGQPVHLIDTARRFPKSARNSPIPTSKPRVKIRIQKKIEFIFDSNHFQHPTQAAQELSGIVKALKEFPQLQITIQGNFQDEYGPRGFGAAARAAQDRRVAFPVGINWPTGLETYNSDGKLMEARARAIQQYLVGKGIAARRVHTTRGQYTKERTVTIIFSN